MRGAGALTCLLLAACGTPKIPSTPTNAQGATVFKGGLIPATTIALSPTTTVTLEKLVYWGGVAAIAYYVLDPQSPNWEIQEAKFPDEHYMLSLKMKRYYAGGAGEARVVFNRRAKELANANGYSGYKILEYSEGLDSNIMGSQRTSEGVVVLTGQKVPPPASPQAQAAPATVLAVAPAPVLPAIVTKAESQSQSSPLPQSKPKPKAKPKKRKDC
ncbi:MAG TPA: hypothetical protein VFW68_08850 [Rhodocyclaceae bacterium]|nr:hypothetical protein [Rhodocyclaceae bacterium]